MLLSEDDIPAIRGKTVMVAGGFDPLHDGHVAYFQAAADLGLPVVCSVDPTTMWRASIRCCWSARAAWR